MVRIRLGQLLLLAILTFSEYSWCFSNEVAALLALKNQISSDPGGVLGEWRAEEGDSLCSWRGITCRDGHITSLELPDASLRGSIAPEISQLSFVEKIDFRGNQLIGPVPRELWRLENLKLLDLSNNRLSGSIPFDVGYLIKLNTLNLARNRFGGVLPRDFGRLVRLKRLQLNSNQFSGAIPETFCNLRRLKRLDLSNNILEGHIPRCIVHPHISSSFDRNCLSSPAGVVISPNSNCGLLHRLLQSKAHKNITEQLESSRKQPAQAHQRLHPQKTHANTKTIHRHHSHLLAGLLIYGIPSLLAFGVTVFLTAIFFHKRRTAAVSPWKAGMSGHLQKVFVTDVPSLSWAELQTACEDFSNIIGSSADSVVFKGTLSDGTEVAVTSIRISAANWTASSEIFFRRKIEALARMKHTHLVNLLAYCAEEEPFARMLVFEYAPNGTLYEHLHNEDSDHLDWSMRMRIVMGAAYGLEYMHHELVPPASHSNFDSSAIYLTEDYAAKLADFGISRLAFIKSERRKSFSNNIGYDDFEGSDRHAPDFENNVFSFGLFLLEVVTGRLPYTDKEGSLLEWALDFLVSPETVGYMVDPRLKDVDVKQVMAICDVVRLCMEADVSKRPTMKGVATMLAKALNLSPQAAHPKTSPLLWAELEILSSTCE